MGTPHKSSFHSHMDVGIDTVEWINILADTIRITADQANPALVADPPNISRMAEPFFRWENNRQCRPFSGVCRIFVFRGAQ